MQPLTWVLLSFALILFLCTRWPRADEKRLEFDSYGHLYMMEEVLRQRRSPFGGVTCRVRSLVPGPYPEPTAWHYLFGHVLGPRRIERNIRWFGVWIEAAYTAVATLMVLYLCGSTLIAVTCLALYVATPATFARTLPWPRQAGASPRMFGEASLGLTLLTVALAYTTPFLWIVVVAEVLLLVLLSKFTRQAVFLLLPLVSLVSLSLMPVLAATIGVIFALLVGRADTVASFLYHLSFMHAYAKGSRDRRRPIHDRYRWLPGVETDTHSLARLVKSLGWIVFRGAFRNPVYIAVIGVPLTMVSIVLVIFHVLASGNSAGTNQVLAAVIPIVAASTGVFVFTSLRVGAFLGESERYLLAALFPMALLLQETSAPVDIRTPITVGLMVFGAAMAIAITTASASRTLRRRGDQERLMEANADREAQAIIDILKLQPTCVVGCYPYHAIGVYRVMRETDHEVVFPYGSSLAHLKEFVATYEDVYPYLEATQASELKENFDLRFVVVSQATYETFNRGVTESGCVIDTVYEGDHLLLIDLQPP